jgi:predicted nucleic acid-binding Zn ribbon protein
MRRGKPLGTAGEALERFLAHSTTGPKVRESLALAYWAEAVGALAAASSEADCVRDGVLFVRTKSSVWSHELSLHKEHILRTLNERLGHAVIKDIRFRAQGIRARTQDTDGAAQPTEAELEATELRPEEQRELERGLGELAAIPDEAIRRSVARRLDREHRLRHWRLDHGWRRCPLCSGEYTGETPTCPFCRALELQR